MSQPAVTHSPSCCKELILLFEEIQPQLERTRHSQALPTHAQVLLSLRLFASGSFQNVIGDTAGVLQLLYSHPHNTTSCCPRLRAGENYHLFTSASTCGA
ncbi:uncharacterized protein LOC135099762 isoform X2 [Scylla paramamosain]|uniref:uncharacterized protein LOC135099762 isoform X2 n=1 Tax=Scylla paramamosain TaxID=85552 RepID=UPI00308287F8